MSPSRALAWGNSPVGVYSAPVFLGLERGLLAAPGVRLETTDNLTGADYTENLVAGTYDMGHIGTPPLFAALSRTDEYVIVGQAVMNAACFYVIAPSHVRSVAELAGTTIALNKLRTCPHSVVRTCLRRHGVDEGGVVLRTLVEGTRINEAIGRGEVAAAVNWEPYVSQAERLYGWRVLADGRTVVTPSNYGYLLYARRALVAAEPALVQALMAGYAASVRYALDHVGEAARTLEGRIPGMASEDIRRGLERDASGWTADTRLDRAFVARIVAELVEQDVVPAGFDVEPFLAPWI